MTRGARVLAGLHRGLYCDQWLFWIGAPYRRVASGDAFGNGKIWLMPAGIDIEQICLTAPHAEVLHLYLPAQPFSSLANDDICRIGSHSLRYLAGIQDEMNPSSRLAVVIQKDFCSAIGQNQTWRRLLRTFCLLSRA